eukprot:4849134-Amphidinium_carterae.1
MLRAYCLVLTSSRQTSGAAGWQAHALGEGQRLRYMMLTQDSPVELKHQMAVAVGLRNSAKYFCFELDLVRYDVVMIHIALASQICYTGHYLFQNNRGTNKNTNCNNISARTLKTLIKEDG